MILKNSITRTRLIRKSCIPFLLKKCIFIIILLLMVYPVWGQSLNTSFTALTIGTRDSSADKGAIYNLDGNSTDGRLNLSSSAIWEVGDNTHILIDGNAGYSYMNGIIKATGLVIVANPTVGGRVDFSSPNGGFETTDLTYVFLGDGAVYNHLESSRNKFSGLTKFIIDMGSNGEAYLQFDNREYTGINIDVKPTNAGDLIIYPARSTTGATSLTGFTTRGLGDSDILYLRRGFSSNSYAKIYDPAYVGVTNNLLQITRNEGGPSSDAKEYFSIDVTNIASDDTKIRVVDGSGTEQHNKFLSDANTKVYANDGVTELRYYTGKKIIPCLVRSITSTSISSTRNTISYLIRRNGYQEISVDNLAMNAPVIINDMTIDESWSNTGTITEISTLDEFYDETQKWLTNNLGTSNFISTNGTEIILENNWNLVLSNSASSLYSVDTTNKIITIKSNTLISGDKFSSISTSGTITVNSGSVLEVGYLDANGINKFIDLDWGSSKALDVKIENIDTNTIISTTNATQVYKAHIQLPNPLPPGEIKLSLTTSGVEVYEEIIPAATLKFTRKNIILLGAIEENQSSMIFLAQKIIQKTEAINNALNGVTPSYNGSTTISTANTIATTENQIAILNLLRQVLLKTTALKGSFD